MPKKLIIAHMFIKIKSELSVVTNIRKIIPWLFHDQSENIDYLSHYRPSSINVNHNI